ncbi:MAG: hypothetical protein ACOYBU_09495 [Dermatophilaceae bacterium]
MLDHAVLFGERDYWTIPRLMSTGRADSRVFAVISAIPVHERAECRHVHPEDPPAGRRPTTIRLITQVALGFQSAHAHIALARSPEAATDLHSQTEDDPHISQEGPKSCVLWCDPSDRQ